MIFTNPSGAPELACDECGCRWFDRLSNTCYECSAEVTPENQAEIKQALEEFEARRLASVAGVASAANVTSDSADHRS